MWDHRKHGSASSCRRRSQTDGWAEFDVSHPFSHLISLKILQTSCWQWGKVLRVSLFGCYFCSRGWFYFSQHRYRCRGEGFIKHDIGSSMYFLHELNEVLKGLLFFCCSMVKFFFSFFCYISLGYNKLRSLQILWLNKISIFHSMVGLHVSGCALEKGFGWSISSRSWLRCWWNDGCRIWH